MLTKLGLGLLVTAYVLPVFAEETSGRVLRKFVSNDVRVERDYKSAPLKNSTCTVSVTEKNGRIAAIMDVSGPKGHMNDDLLSDLVFMELLGEKAITQLPLPALDKSGYVGTPLTVEYDGTKYRAYLGTRGYHETREIVADPNLERITEVRSNFYWRQMIPLIGPTEGRDVRCLNLQRVL